MSKILLILLFYIVFVFSGIFCQTCPGQESLIVGPNVCVWRCSGTLGSCGYNGTCQANGQCACGATYLQQSSNKLLCFPRCLTGCQNNSTMHCLARGFCDCGPNATYDAFNQVCVARGSLDLCPGFCQRGGKCAFDQGLNRSACQCALGWMNTDANKTECVPNCVDQNK